MCKLIADLVGADKHIVGQVVQRLERASGQPGIDVRLTGELYGSAHMKMRELGLDPNDTTGRELYQALLNMANLHDKFLADRLGIKDRTKTHEVADAVADLVNKLHIPKTALAVKGSVIKRILKAHPPRTLMVALHYRSLDSMLKREHAHLLLTIARHIESDKWQQQVSKEYSSLSSGDFETREVRIQYLDELKWSAALGSAAKSHHSNTFYSAEAATIVLTPLPQRSGYGLALALFMMTLHYLHEIRMHSTYIKFHQLSANLSEKLTDITKQSSAEHAAVAGQPLHWRIVHRYYGKSQRILHPEMFEPHVQPEDLAYRKAEELLYKLEPALHFWHNTDYLGIPRADGAISFNLMDNLLCLLNNVPYEQRMTYHQRDALWNELLIRYVGQRPLERQLVRHLEEQTLDQTVFNDMEFAL